jgi:hypothetical protein
MIAVRILRLFEAVTAATAADIHAALPEFSAPFLDDELRKLVAARQLERDGAAFRLVAS